MLSKLYKQFGLIKDQLSMFYFLLDIELFAILLQ